MLKDAASRLAEARKLLQGHRGPRTTIADFIIAADWKGLADYAVNEYGLPWLEPRELAAGLAPLYFHETTSGVLKLAREGYWSESTVRMWLKKRLGEYGLFEGVGVSPPDVGEWTSAVMHVFFIGIEESAVMMARLHNEHATPVGPALATPGIERTPEKPTPVDRVAARVTTNRVPRRKKGEEGEEPG